MKKILLIAYSYPPLEDAQSLRWYYISQELAKLGYKIDIVTITHPAKLSYSIEKNITLHRVYAGFFESIAYSIKTKIGVDDSSKQKQRQSFLFKIMKKGYWIVRTFVGGMLSGNISTEWYPHAKRYIDKNLDISLYDFMITSHEPWVDSLLGYSIKKKYPSLLWVADFGDPYVSIYTPRYKLFFENKIEKKIYKKVDLMILTNKAVQDKLRSKYPFLNQKDTLILEQGFSRSNYKEGYKSDTFTIIYTGTFYEEFRNPTQLSYALSKLDFDFRFIVAGRNEEFNELFKPLGEKYQFLGIRSHHEVLELQKRSDLLVHISNKQIEQVPGKFYEYLGVGKPILVIYQDMQDQLLPLCKDIGIDTVCKNDPNDIKDTINRVYNDRNFHYNQDILQNYSWQNRALKLDDTLRKSDI